MIDSTLLPATVSTTATAIVATQDIGALLNAWASQLAKSTRRTYGDCLVDFQRFAAAATVEGAVGQLLGHGRPAAKAAVIAYRADLHDVRGLAPATTNLRLAALKSLIAFAEDLDVIAWQLKVRPVRSQTLRDTAGPGRPAVRQMLDQVAGRDDAKGSRDVAIIRLFFDLGLRRKELAGLDVADVDLVAGRCRILGKGRSEHEWITLPPETCKAVADWLDHRGRDPGPLFTSLSNNSIRQRITGSGLYSVIRSLGRDAAGVATSPHRLRHSSITTACEVEPDLGKVQRFSRHTNSDMVFRYRDNLVDAGGEIARKVAAALEN